MVTLGLTCCINLLLTYFRSTPLLQDWLGTDAHKRMRREIHFPGGRFGEAVEQAQAVLFLASDESSFVNGTDFTVDGGMTKVIPTIHSQLLHPTILDNHADVLISQL